tara:strand:+ start:328 stop:915 length:588 start_codon:yes stop_codon:yes gene_type:complete
MTYNSGPSNKHNERMMMQLNLFENEYTLPNQLPPENSSATALDEIKYIKYLEIDKDFVKEHDNIKKVFKKTLAELELPYIQEEMDNLVKESGKFIIELKYKYNRPRPFQLAEFYGIELNGIDLDSMRTPSYPSGHAVQGYLISKYYSDKYPEYAKEFKTLGENIAQSRVIAKAHYPSDKNFGKTVAEYLYTILLK